MPSVFGQIVTGEWRGLYVGKNANDTPNVAVISDGYWRRRFGANPNAVGQHLVLDNGSWQIVGVTTSPGVESHLTHGAAFGRRNPALEAHRAADCRQLRFRFPQEEFNRTMK